MKQLIISDYDSSCEFTYVIIDNGIEIKRGGNPKDVSKYGLYDEDWCMFNGTGIDFKENKSLQDFDMIIVCEDGCIDIYKREE